MFGSGLEWADEKEAKICYFTYSPKVVHKASTGDSIFVCQQQGRPCCSRTLCGPLILSLLTFAMFPLADPVPPALCCQWKAMLVDASGFIFHTCPSCIYLLFWIFVVIFVHLALVKNYLLVIISQNIFTIVLSHLVWKVSSFFWMLLISSSTHFHRGRPKGYCFWRFLICVPPSSFRLPNFCYHSKGLICFDVFTI